MKLLEVIRISATSDETFGTLLQFGKALGKTTVSCKVIFLSQRSSFSICCLYLLEGYARFYRQSSFGTVYD